MSFLRSLVETRRASSNEGFDRNHCEMRRGIVALEVDRELLPSKPPYKSSRKNKTYRYCTDQSPVKIQKRGENLQKLHRKNITSLSILLLGGPFLSSFLFFRFLRWDNATITCCVLAVISPELGHGLRLRFHLLQLYKYFTVI